MMPKWVSYYLFYYRLYGFYPKNSKNLGGQILNSVIFIGHIILCTWCSIRAVDTFMEEQSLMEFLDAFNFFTYYLNYGLLYWLIIYDSYANRTATQEFWYIFIRFNKQFCKRMNFQAGAYLISSIALTTFNLSMFAFTIICENSVGSTMSIIMHHIFINIFDKRMLFYILHLKVIAYELMVIELELTQLEKLNRYNRKKGEKKRLFMYELEEKEFKRIREYYGLVHEMASSMNTVFGWSHVTLVIMIFHTLVTYLNFAYGQIHKKFSNFDSGG